MANRRSMSANQLSKEYSNEVNKCIRFACTRNNNNLIRCSYMRCYYVNIMKTNDVKDYLFIHGIDKGYTPQIWHGEIKLFTMSSNYQDKGSWHLNNVGLDAWLQDMVHDVIEDI